MLQAVAKLSAEIAQETDPLSVLEVLAQTAAARAGVRVFAAYRLTKEKTDGYHYGKNVFWDREAQGDYPEYLAHLRQHGPTALWQESQRYRQAFTFTEALRRITPSGNDRWVFDFYQRLGRRDGLFCPCGRWNVIFTSAAVLRLPFETRALLFAAANIAASRMEEVIDHRGLDRREQPSLSPRELAVLQHLSRGQPLAETAQALAIHLGSAKTLLARAQKKLGTRHYVHAVAEALRLNLIN